jgi:hypothetical protein
MASGMHPLRVMRSPLSSRPPRTSRSERLFFVFASLFAIAAICADTASAQAEPLSRVPGLGPLQALRLRAKGFRQVEDLLARPFAVDARRLSTPALTYLNRRLRENRSPIPTETASGLREGVRPTEVKLGRGRPTPSTTAAAAAQNAEPRSVQTVYRARNPLDPRYQFGVSMSISEFLAPVTFPAEAEIARDREKAGLRGPDWRKPLRVAFRVLTQNGALLRKVQAKEGLVGTKQTSTSLDLRVGQRDVWAHSTIALDLPAKAPQRAAELAEFQLRSAVARYFDGKYELVDRTNPKQRYRVHVDVDIKRLGEPGANFVVATPWKGRGAVSSRVPLSASLRVWGHEAAHFLFAAVDEYDESFRHVASNRLMASGQKTSPSYLLTVGAALTLVNGRRFAVARASGGADQP